MKPKTMILMVVAVACGLVASYMTSRLLADRNNQPADTKVTVVVAKKKVPQLTLIRKPEDLFELQEVSESPMTAKAVKSLEELQGKRVKNAVKEGDFIRVDDLQKKDELIIEVPPGQRAIAIKVSAQQQLSGLILPGMRVDVLATMRGSEATSSIILQNMLVLAIDATPVRGEGQTTIVGQTATLAATPDECQHLLLAQSQGELCLALRSPEDKRLVAAHVTRTSDLSKAPRDRNPETGEVTESSTDPNPASVSIPKMDPTPVVVEPTPTPPVKADPEPPAEPKREEFKLRVITGPETKDYVFTKDPETGEWNGGRSAASSDEDAPAQGRKTKSKAEPKQEPKQEPAQNPAK